ncbi:hypothetical protein UlMin_040366 [Ulmus minor]
MAETSRNRVTITLGRSGQVVRKAGSTSNVSFNDSLPPAGTKRSVRDRLGSNADRSSMHGSVYNTGSKRQRGDIGTSSLSANGDDVRIGKHDLRLKLMKKDASRREHSNDDREPEDLRDKLTKAVRPPVRSLISRQHLHEPRERNMYGQTPSTRSADDLTKMDSHRNSYSTWTMDHIRRRSPDRVLSSSRGHSPPRNVEELQRRPLNRTLNDVRSVSYVSKDVFDNSRPLGSLSFTSNSALPPGSVKPVAVAPRMSQLPPPPSSSVLSKGPYMVAEQTVDGLLHSLGLGKYAVLFKAEEVDMTALKQMGENDLKELGIPMGPRKKLLLALLPRPKRQQ